MNCSIIGINGKQIFDYERGKVLEEEVKKILLEQYGSVKKFSEINNIPYHTVNNAFRRGFISCKLGNLGLILHALGISVDTIQFGEIVYLPLEEEG